MLVNEERLVRMMCLDPIFKMIANANHNPAMPIQLDTGIYQIGHYGGTGFLKDYEAYPENLSIAPYGVCDHKDQILFNCPELLTSERQFVITMTPVSRITQSEHGGWRWHKWGPYIGTQKRSGCEYLYDEPEIEIVYTYHIYEKL